jgi:short-subunit dehydrogenase
MENRKATQRKMMVVATVAEAGYKALKRAKPIGIPILIYKFAPVFAGVAPRKVFITVIRSQHERLLIRLYLN